MKENRNYGFRIRFYFGIILIIAACVIGFFNFQKPDAKKSTKMEKPSASQQATMIKNQS